MVAQHESADAQFRRLLNSLRLSPTGNHLLLGLFVLPYAPSESDPRANTNVPDGDCLLWIRNGTDLMCSIYSRTLRDWQTAVFQWPVTVMETRTDDPVDPVTGRFWLRTDL